MFFNLFQEGCTMPMYELVILLKKLNPEGLKTALTRNAKYVIETGGNLRKMENLGFMDTPFAITKKGQPIARSAHYFLFNYDAGLDQQKEIIDKFKRDLDVMRSTSFTINNSQEKKFLPVKKMECTLHEDFLPAPMRPKVIELLNIAAKHGRFRKRKFKFNNGLNYDPL